MPEFMAMATLAKPAAQTIGKLNLFSLHADFPASVRACWLTTTIARIAGESWKPVAGMWTLDNLKASDSIVRMITKEAMQADVMIIAVSSPSYGEPTLESLAAGPGNCPGAGLLVGLLEDEAEDEGESRELVKLLRDRAQPLGRDFVWMKDFPDETGSLIGKLEILLKRKQRLA